jgi:hypothetical protein
MYAAVLRWKRIKNGVTKDWQHHQACNEVLTNKTSIFTSTTTNKHKHLTYWVLKE